MLGVVDRTGRFTGLSFLCVTAISTNRAAPLPEFVMLDPRPSGALVCLQGSRQVL